MPEKKKKYYDELNIFRAIVIIWVVIGHSFDAKGDLFGFLHFYAYTFHMKAFFILSGILFASALVRISGIKDAGRLVISRFKRLMVPYFFFTAVSYVLKLFLERYAKNDLSSNILFDALTGRNNPNGGIWFLFALFWISLLAIALCKLPPWLNLIITLCLFTLKTLTVYLDYPIVRYIAEYAVFFFLGIFLAKYYDKISEFFKRLFESRKALCIALSLFAFALSVIVTSLYFKGTIAFKYFGIILIFYNTLCAYFLSLCILEATAVKRAFMCIGNYGMDIYMIGYYVQITLRVVLMSMLSLPYLAYALPMCIFGLLLPIPISKYFVRKFRITRALMLGNFKKEKITNVKEA